MQLLIYNYYLFNIELNCHCFPESVKLPETDYMGPSSILYPESTPDIPTQQLSLCLRKSEDILFYQYRVTSEDTTRTEDTFEYAIENLETGEVELHVWTLSEGMFHIHSMPQ